MTPWNKKRWQLLLLKITGEFYFQKTSEGPRDVEKKASLHRAWRYQIKRMHRESPQVLNWKVDHEEKGTRRRTRLLPNNVKLGEEMKSEEEKRRRSTRKKSQVVHEEDTGRNGQNMSRRQALSRFWVGTCKRSWQQDDPTLETASSTNSKHSSIESVHRNSRIGHWDKLTAFQRN